MGLLRKKAEQPAAKPAKTSAGRSLLMYFLPSVVVAILLMAAIVSLAQQGLHRAGVDNARAMANNAAAAIATRLEGEIRARQDMLRLLLADGAAVRLLADGRGDAIAEAQRAMQRRIPGLLQLRLLPADANQPDPSGPAPFGYAGLDMLRRTVETGQPAAAEVHQIKTGVPYLAMATPVTDRGRVVGALFSAWDMRFLTTMVENAPPFPGQLQLTQGGEGGYVLAEGPGQAGGARADGNVDVPQAIWQVSYRLAADGSAGGGLMTALGLVFGGAVALSLAVFLQWRYLSRDLRADMSTIVNIGEALSRREVPPTRRPLLAATRDAIALLGQYARDAREGAAPPRAPQAGAAPVAPATAPAGRPADGVEVEELDDNPAEVLGGGAPVRPSVDVAASLFRANDVRGVFGETLTVPVAELLGLAVGSSVREQGGKRVAVAHDARLSSPELTAALHKGLIQAGCDVLDLGQAPTPLLYFAMTTQGVHGAVMVTGSHNPPDYNGFKIAVGETVLEGDALLALRQRMLDGGFSHGSGAIESVSLVDAYADAVVQEVQLARPLKVVVDAGNGVAGELALATFESLGCEIIPLFIEPDGSFPNHHPDPSQPENLASLMLEVEAQQADLGLSFDGDGDRLGVIDNSGANIWPDRLLMLLAADVLGRHPGVDILYDVKSSRHLASFILGHGGRPIMWQSGHARMRAKMLETGALLGGEFTGHLFIKERWYGFDDAIYAAARVLEILALDPRPTAEVFAELPASPSTPEYHLLLDEGQSGDLMRALEAHKVFEDARLVEIDGLRVEFANGWGLVRPSTTMPSLTFRFEADDEGALEEIKARFRDLLRRVAPDAQAPF